MTRHVLERFPDSENRISDLYREDHEFRSLCHDYGVCVEELRKASNPPDAHSKMQRMVEFRDIQVRGLQAELESEIVEYVAANLSKTH